MASRLRAQRPSITLDEALRLATTANAHLPLAAINADILRARLREQLARNKPGISLDGDVHVGGPAAYTSSDARLQLLLTDTLFDGGRVRASITNVRRLSRAAEAGYRVVQKDLALGVRLRFADGLHAQRSIEIRRARVDRLQSFLTLVEAQAAGGLGVTGDLLRTRTRVAAEQANIADAERALDEALVELNNLMGREPREPLTLVPTPTPPAPLTAEGRPWSAVPDIVQAEASASAAQAALGVERADRRPQIAVTADLGRQQPIGSAAPGMGLNIGRGTGAELTLGGAPQPIDVKIFGDNEQALETKVKQVAAAISGVRGVADVFDGLTIAGPSLTIRVKPAAATYGLSTQDIQAAVVPAVSGTVVDTVQIQDRVYDLRLFAPAADSLGALKLRAKPPASGLVPLSLVANVGTGAPEVEIDRENLKTYFGVTARLAGRDLGSTMRDVRSAVRRTGVGSGMTVEYGGLYQQQQQSFRSLLFVLLSGLVLVGVVVLFEFADWRAPLVTIVCAVAVLTGVLGALLLTGQTLNISSYVGAIMMVGIVGENAIFVIHEARLGLARGLDPADAWRESAHRRLRPVAMTIIATAFALAPLALALGAGAQLMQPLAIAVIGGFVLSGPIVLLVLPGLYHLLDPHGRLGDGA